MTDRKLHTVYAISRQPKWYNNALRMQERSLESTEICQKFSGGAFPVPPLASRAFDAALLHSKHFMSPNPLQ